MAILSYEEMWEAVGNNDSAYDGIFFYGVKSTGIFCRPSCKSKRPVRENVCYFANPAAAMNDGYRPCKRCRPDLPETALQPMEEVTGRVKRILETEYDHPDILKELPGRVGVSPGYLQRSYKKLTGVSLKTCLEKIRIQKARELLLKNKELNQMEICFLVGFQSLSSFYSRFRIETGLTPGEYARSCAKKKDAATGGQFG